MKIFWYVIYMTSAFFICIILPFALFYYESDEDKSFVSFLISFMILIETETVDSCKILTSAYSNYLNHTLRFLCRAKVRLATLHCEYLSVLFCQHPTGIRLSSKLHFNLLVYKNRWNADHYRVLPNLCDSPCFLDRLVVTHTLLGQWTHSTPSWSDQLVQIPTCSHERGCVPES